jgi:hypothetical protein
MDTDFVKDRVVNEFEEQNAREFNLSPKSNEPEPMELDDEQDTQANQIIEINDTLSGLHDPRLRSKMKPSASNESQSSIGLLPDSELIANAQMQLEALNQVEQQSDHLKYSQPNTSNSSAASASPSHTKIKFKIERKEGNCLNTFGRSTSAHKPNN